MSYTTAFKTTAFNPASRSSGALLDGYDRELSGPTSPATGSYAVLGVNSIANTQKKYMEFTVGAVSSAGVLVGLGTTSLSATTNLGANTLGFALDSVSGDIIHNGAAMGLLSITYGAGDVICMAIDRPNNAFWFRKNGGNWNGNPLADPVANIGGLSIPGTMTGNLYIAALVKVASSVTSKVSMNVGHTAFAQTRPTGYLVWTGLTDSAYIQQIINAAVVDRTHIVVLPIARYDCRSQIVLPAGFKLMGSGRMHHSYPNTDLPDGVATVLDVNWGSGASSSGDSTKVAVLLGRAASVESVAFCYPGQVPTSNPVEWGSTIAPNPADLAWDQKIKSCYFQKSYVAMDFRGSVYGNQALGSVDIEGNRGSPIHTGIWMDYLTDFANVKDNWFNANWMDPFQGYRTLLTWTANNGVGFRADGNDWLTIDRFQVFGYSKGVHVRPGAGSGSTGPYRIIDSNMDGCFTGVYLDSTAYYNQAVTIRGCNFAAYNGATAAQGFPLVCGTLGAVGIMFENNYSFGSTGGVINAPTATVGLFTILNNQADGGAGAAALNLGGGITTYNAGNRFGGFI